MDKSQSLLGTKGLTSRKSRKPYGGLRGLQFARPWADQGANKLQKSQALWGTKGLTSRKPFGRPRGLYVPKVASPFGGPRCLQVASPLAYKSQKSQNKRHTSRKSRKPFGGPRSLQVSLLREPGAHESQALWWTKALAQVASPLGDQGAYKSPKS